MFNFFGNRKNKSHYKVDFHSHLVPGIDDGCKDLNESIEILELMTSLGFEKMITTPHIHAEYFPNTEDDIVENFSKLKKELTSRNLSIQLDVAAEYYVDDSFMGKMEANHPFLSFGDNHILVETAFINRPVFLDDMIFGLSSKGYKVILAHPERYMYIQEDFGEIKRLKERGVFMQLNLGSLSGMYSNEIKRLAEKMIEAGLVDFIGSDCHRIYQVEYLEQSFSKKSYKKLKKLPILNDKLL